MLGVLANVLAIIIGGLVGAFCKKGIKENYKETIIQGLALCTIIMGISSTIKPNNFLLVIISIVIGIIIGEFLNIEDKIEKIGDNLKNRFKNSDSKISEGFVTTTLIFCSGAMAVIGSLEAGLNHNYSTLFTKSILDGVSALIFASTFGIGVVFSSICVLIYQGAIAIGSFFLKDLLSTNVINDISAIGGILILGIGFNILGITKIKISNMIPAILIPIIYYNIF